MPRIGRIQIVLFELVAKRIAPDAKDACSLGLIAARRFERMNQKHALMLLERPRVRGGRGKFRLFLVVRGSSKVRGEVLHIDRVVHGHHSGMPDDILQFTDVPRPGVPGKPDLRAVRETKYEAAASGVAQDWAKDGGQDLLSTTYERGQVQLNLERSATPADTSALPALMHGAVPSGTLIVVNQIPGQQQRVGQVR